jgi:hypothetical protein
VILVLAGLQAAGVVNLEEYFTDDARTPRPDKIDPRTIWLAVAGLALFQFLIVAIGVLQGWAAIRRARQLRQQSAPGGSNVGL